MRQDETWWTVHVCYPSTQATGWEVPSVQQPSYHTTSSGLAISLRKPCPEKEAESDLHGHE